MRGQYPCHVSEPITNGETDAASKAIPRQKPSFIICVHVFVARPGLECREEREREGGDTVTVSLTGDINNNTRMKLSRPGLSNSDNNKDNNNIKKINKNNRLNNNNIYDNNNNKRNNYYYNNNSNNNSNKFMIIFIVIRKI